MSNIQVHYTQKGTTKAIVILVDIIAIASLLQFHEIPLILSFPLFLIPIAAYTTTAGFKTEKSHRGVEASRYHFTWAGIMSAVGIGWIVLYEGIGIIAGIICILSITLGFIYLHKAKARTSLAYKQ